MKSECKVYVTITFSFTMKPENFPKDMPFEDCLACEKDAVAAEPEVFMDRAEDLKIETNVF